MGFGTIVYKNEIYNLDYMASTEISKLLNSVEKSNEREEIILSAKLKSIYTNKMSNEMISQKLSHQLNSMNASIFNINAKFNEKSKNYELVNSEILETLNKLEEVLKCLANSFDIKIQKLIYKQLELRLDDKEEEKKLIKMIAKKQKKLAELKKEKIFSSMEVGGKEISVNLAKKRIKIGNVKNFFKFKFNTYKAIQKNVIEPVNERINEFKMNELKQYNTVEKIEFIQVDKKIKEIIQYCKSPIVEKNKNHSY